MVKEDVMSKVKVYYKGETIVAGLRLMEGVGADIPDTDGCIELEPAEVEGKDLHQFRVVDGELVRKNHLRLELPETLKVGGSATLIVEYVDGAGSRIEETGQQIRVSVSVDRGKLETLAQDTVKGSAAIGYTAPDETILVTVTATANGFETVSQKIQLEP